MRDPYSKLRAEYRALAPCSRRRQHLVLLQQVYYGPVSGHGTALEVVTLRAVVRSEDTAVLRPLIARLKSRSVEDRMLRIAITEDGLFDLEMLWSAANPAR